MCEELRGKKQLSEHAGRFVFVRLGQKGGKLRVDPVGKQTPTAGTAAAAAEPVRVSVVCVRLAGGQFPAWSNTKTLSHFRRPTFSGEVFPS